MLKLLDGKTAVTPNGIGPENGPTVRELGCAT